jgi:hypothetical protein
VTADWVTAIATVGLVVVAIFAGVAAYRQIKEVRVQVMESRRQTELSRQIELSQTFLELTRRWNDTLFREARMTIREYYGEEKNAVHVRDKLLAMRSVSASKRQYWECVDAIHFFETVAMLIKQDSITFEIVDDVWGFVVWDYWAMLYEFVGYMRDEPPPDGRYCIEFERLAERLTTKNRYDRPWAASPGERGEGPGPSK